MSWPTPTYEPRSLNVEPAGWSRVPGKTNALYFSIDQVRKQLFIQQEKKKKEAMIQEVDDLKMVSDDEDDSF